MKIITTILFSFLFIPLMAQNLDSLTLDFEEYQILKNVDNQSFYIINKGGKKLYRDLRFVRYLIGGGLQVLDNKNNVFYLNEEMLKVDLINNSIGFCGTVPHYEMIIVKKEKKFIVQENGRRIDSIPMSKADSVFFTNYKTKINFTANYGAGKLFYTKPRTVIYIKDGKYGILGLNNGLLYDTISWGENLLKISLNGLVGFYDIDPTPKYKNLDNFTHYLSKYEYPNGESGFLDIHGQEYEDE